MKVIHFFIVTLVVLLSGCSERGRVFSRLVEADSLLSKEKPDSARLLLDAISPSVLQTDEEKAFLLNSSPGAVRTMRSRLAKLKNLS